MRSIPTLQLGYERHEAARDNPAHRVSEWLDQARHDLALAVGDQPAAYELSAEDVSALLELAGVAAHESGDRKNAPLTTYLLGLARGRHPEQSVADLLAAIAGPRDG